MEHHCGLQINTVELERAMVVHIGVHSVVQVSTDRSFLGSAFLSGCVYTLVSGKGEVFAYDLNEMQTSPHWGSSKAQLVLHSSLSDWPEQPGEVMQGHHVLPTAREDFTLHSAMRLGHTLTLWAANSPLNPCISL